MGSAVVPEVVEQVGHVLAAHGGLGLFDHCVVDGLREFPQRLEAPRRMIGRTAEADNLLDLGEGIAFAAERVEGLQIVVLEEAIDRDEEPGVRVSEHMGELTRRRPGVDGDHGAAEDGDREISEDPLGPVAHEEADLVAPAHAERVEALCEPAPPRRAVRDS